MNDFHVGMIVPSSNLTMETELPRMLHARENVRPDERFVFHSSRMRMKHVTADELRAMNAQTGRAATELADAKPDVVASACLVAIMAQGANHHVAAEAEITSALRAGGSTAPALSSAGALMKAAGDLGARRVAIITPYMKPLTKMVADYIENGGIEVADTLSLEVSDNLAVAKLEPADLKDHWRKLSLDGVDAIVLSACVQMPSLSAIEAVEAETGIPVFSAATATAYAILDTLGLDTVVPHAGHLLGGEVGAQRVSS